MAHNWIILLMWICQKAWPGNLGCYFIIGPSSREARVRKTGWGRVQQKECTLRLPLFGIKHNRLLFMRLSSKRLYKSLLLQTFHKRREKNSQASSYFPLEVLCTGNYSVAPPSWACMGYDWVLEPLMIQWQQGSPGVEGTRQTPQAWGDVLLHCSRERLIPQTQHSIAVEEFMPTVVAEVRQECLRKYQSCLMSHQLCINFPHLNKNPKSNTVLSWRKSILARKTQPKLLFLFSWILIQNYICFLSLLIQRISKFF